MNLMSSVQIRLPGVKKVAQRHQMVSGSLALPYFLLGFHGGKQGSGPDRGQSPVEWGDFPFVRPSICPSVRSPHWAIQLGLRPIQLGLRSSQLSLRLGCLAGWASDLAGWASGLTGWASGLGGCASGQAGWPRGGNGQADGQTENLPILQDFVPFGLLICPNH